MSRQFTINEFKNCFARSIYGLEFGHLVNPYLFNVISLTLLNLERRIYDGNLRFQFEIKYTCPVLKEESKEKTIIVESIIEYISNKETEYGLMQKVIEGAVTSAYKEVLKTLIPIFFPKGLEVNEPDKPINPS